MVVGCDLSIYCDGTVATGIETNLTCHKAAQEFHAIRGVNGDPLIIATAGNAGKKWKNKIFASAIKEYILKFDPTIKGYEIITKEAETFDTDGEMKAFSDIVLEYDPCRVVIATKKWHAWRCKILCNYWIKRKVGKRYRISTVYQDFTNASSLTVCKEYFVAVPYWTIKLALRKLRPPA